MRIEYEIRDTKQLLKDSFKNIIIKLEEVIRSNKKYLENIDNNLKLYDPKKQLKLGYSIVKKQGKVLKSKTQVKLEDELEILLADGTINTKINKIN
jgi:exodeoxyribonuclease VII large subunit